MIEGTEDRQSVVLKASQECPGCQVSKKHLLCLHCYHKIHQLPNSDVYFWISKVSPENPGMVRMGAMGPAVHPVFMDSPGSLEPQGQLELLVIVIPLHVT